MCHSFLRKDADPVQVGAALALLAAKGVHAHELAGFHSILRSVGTTLDFDDLRIIDMCGTGGDWKNTFNISTIAACVAAGAGIKVAKHGNYSASSHCGASNVLEAAGVPFHADHTTLRRQLESNGLCVLHAPLFQPLLKYVAPVRKALGIRTCFNLLGPLLNPCVPQCQLIGVADASVVELYHRFLSETDLSYTLVHSHDGYDEISLTGSFLVRTRESVHEYVPEDLGLSRCAEGDLFGGTTVPEALHILEEILNGNGTQAQNEAVIVNAAFALLTYDAALTIEVAIKKARESLESGSAQRCFNSLRCK